MYEPDAAHLAIGQRNFARNGFAGHFEIAAAGLGEQATGCFIWRLRKRHESEGYIQLLASFSAVRM